jgi:hypothetical protein
MKLIGDTTGTAHRYSCTGLSGMPIYGINATLLHVDIFRVEKTGAGMQKGAPGIEGIKCRRENSVFHLLSAFSLSSVFLPALFCITLY